MLISRPNFNNFTSALRNNRILPLLSSEIKVMITQRTQEDNKDKHGRTFRRYSPLYSIQKRREFGSSRVNLTRTAQMLNSLTHTTTRQGVKFHFSNSEANSKAYYNILKGRNFMGLTNREKQYIRDRLERECLRLLRQ